MEVSTDNAQGSTNKSVESVNVWSDAKVLLHMPLLSQLLT